MAPAETLGLWGSRVRQIHARRAHAAPDTGHPRSVFWLGMDLLHCDAATLRRQRRDLQIVFQDPLGSLDPRMTAGKRSPNR